MTERSSSRVGWSKAEKRLVEQKADQVRKQSARARATTLTLSAAQRAGGPLSQATDAEARQSAPQPGRVETLPWHEARRRRSPGPKGAGNKAASLKDEADPPMLRCQSGELTGRFR